MSKEKSVKPSKKDRKEKEKKVDDEGRVKKDKKDKKEKKAKKEKLGAAVTDALVEELENKRAPEPSLALVKTDNDDDTDIEDAEEVDGVLITTAEGALVPFANPLADDKQTKKLMKSVKKAAKHKAIRRGVKEVVKSLRKTSSTAPASSGNSSPPCIVIIAADISPMDVISHLPVLCEDHNIPYIYVRSRADLGAAGSTKRPTSVVMLTEKTTSKKDKKEDDSEYAGVYADLVKLVQKAQAGVKV